MKMLRFVLLCVSLCFGLSSPLLAQSAVEQGLQRLVQESRGFENQTPEFPDTPMVALDGFVEWEVSRRDEKGVVHGRISVMFDLTQGEVSAEIYGLESNIDIAGLKDQALFLEGYVTQAENGNVNIFLSHPEKKVGPSLERTTVELRSQGEFFGGIPVRLKGPMVGSFKVGATKKFDIKGGFLSKFRTP